MQIGSDLEIGAYFHCNKCLQEIPENVSPREFQRVQVGFTEIGLQVWCVRHDINVIHIDFEGMRHPANTGYKKAVLQ